MIRPYKGKNIQPYNPTVIDLETAPDGSIIGVGFAYDIDGIVYGYYNTLDEWFTDYMVLHQRYRRDRSAYYKLSRIYAHNGANFDYLCIYEYFYERGYITGGKYLMADSAGIGCQFEFRGIDGPITFLDSYRMMPASLDKLTKTFHVQNIKQEIPKKCKNNYLIFKQNYTDLFQSYLRSDVLGLQQVIRSFWEMIYTMFGSIGYLPMTLPSLSLRVFSKFLKADLMTPESPKLKALEREAYKGGLTLCMNTGIYEHINVYDVNSMYPYHMADKMYPASYVGYWTKTFNPNVLGLWRASYEQTATHLPPFLFDTVQGAVYRGSGVFSTQELVYLQTIGGSFTISEAYVYTQSDSLFSDFITTLYTRRVLAQEQKDAALDFTLKIMMNSLYGKFGQKTEGYSVELATIDRQKELLQKKIPFKCYGNFIAVLEHRVVPHVFVGLAAHVTAYARIDLHQRMTQMIECGETVVYCDTDSVHTTGTFQETTGLGGMKLEFNGRGAYAGRKLYALKQHEDTIQIPLAQIVKIKAKGIGRKIQGANLSYDRIAELAHDHNATQSYAFETFPSVKEVLSEKRHSAVIEAKSRTIRNTGGIWDNKENMS